MSLHKSRKSWIWSASFSVITENDADHIQDLRDLCNDIYSKYFSKIYEKTPFANQNYQNMIVKISRELLLS